MEQQVFVRDSCAGETFQLVCNQGFSEIAATAKATAVLVDGDIVFVGNGYGSSTNGNDGFYMAKMHPDGTLLWAKTIEINNYSFACSSVVASSDGGFVLGLNKFDNCSVAKFNADGTLSWIQRFQVSSATINDLKINADQDILVLGYNNDATATKGLFFAKFGPSGNLLWTRFRTSPPVGEQWFKLVALPDGGLMGIGQVNAAAGPQLIRISADGDQIWRVRPAINNQGLISSTIASQGNSVFLSGGGLYTLWLMKINLDGQVLWLKTYMGDGFYMNIREMILADNGLTLTGTTSPFSEPQEGGIIVRFDTAGTLLWNRIYSHEFGGAFNSLTALPSGGYFTVGQLPMDDIFHSTAWLLKLDKFGFAGSCPAKSVTLVTTDGIGSTFPQTYGSPQAPFGVDTISFNILDVSLLPTLLCEKACPTGQEICNNNLDDDGDGLFDCLDPDCPCTEDACQPKRNNHWYFGKNAGLDFSTEPPTILTDGKTNGGDTGASISDGQGNLLFYTDGWQVFNRFHDVMPHGVNPNPLTIVDRVTCIIIPYPGEPALYYMFVHDRTNHFYYALIDMRLDNGRGDVVATKAFKSLSNGNMQIQGLTATRSCAFNGYWLAVSPMESNQLYAYRIDQNGLNLNPVISPAGDAGPVLTLQLKFSPNGQQLARSILGDSLTLYDFEPYLSQIGQFVNPRKFQVAESVENSYGIEYSPSGRYLYVVSYKLTQPKSALYQFDLEAGDLSAIANSRVELATDTHLQESAFFRLQLAPNGKIYVAHSLAPYRTIDIIHQPDAPGLACHFQKSGIELPLATQSFIGFSNCITSDFRQPHIAFPTDAPDSICTLNAPVSYQIKSVNCDVDSIQWSLAGLTGTIVSMYQYATVTYLAPGQGQLIITAYTACGQASDTLAVTVYAPLNKILNLGPDRTVCDNGVFTFNAGNGFAQYHWQNGSTDSVFTTLLPGKYWVDVYDPCGNRQTDTVIVQIAPASVLALGPDLQQCAGIPIPFQRPAAFASWQWSPDTSLSCDTCGTILVDPATTTTWTVLARTADGCLSLDTLHWQIVDTLFYSRDTSVCVGQTLDLYGVALPADTTANFMRPNSGPGCDVNPECQLIIPNAFTPNGDGVNDWFYPVADPCVRSIRLWRVANRWGQIVFERRNFAPNQPELGWDGRLQGQETPSDVLVWMAELEYFDGRIEQRRGEVTLLR